MNVDRARQYLTQARELRDRLEGTLTIPPDAVGTWRSLRHNLDAAAADLEPLEEE